MKNFIKFLKSLFKKEKRQDPVTPPVVTPPVVTPPVVTPPVVTPPVVTPPVNYPRVERFGGLYVRIVAPMNSAWLPGLGNGFGLTPNTPLYEPARPEGARSPVGYPTVDGKVLFNGSIFDNDSAVEAYVAAVARRDASIAEWERNFKATYYLGPVDATRLTMNDVAWLYRKSYEYRIILQVHNGDLHRVVLKGFNLDIARCINNGEQHDIQTHHQAEPDGEQRDILISSVEAAFEAAKAGTPIEPKFEVRL